MPSVPPEPPSETSIRNPSGEVVFEMNNVEVPKQWSQIATDILAQKYFRKAGVPQPDGSLGRETSVKQVAHRMAHCWRVWGEKYGYFASERDAGTSRVAMLGIHRVTCRLS